jgi:DnaJ-domain-containing protein 1
MTAAEHSEIPPGLDWPVWADPTPEAQREQATKFDIGQRQTERQLETEMERMDVSAYHLGKSTGRGGWPGVVVRWQKYGREYAVCCDKYTSRTSNLRALYLWINETRKAGDRPVRTGQDQMAAAAFPGETATGQAVAAPDPEREPHEVLEVAPDASAAVVKAAYRQKSKEAHGDQGGSTAAMKRLNAAKEAMLDE